MMPELPEVSKVAMVLNDRLNGQKILKIEVISSSICESDLTVLLDKMLLNVDRKGKYLIFTFADYYLVAHMRMEGRFYHTKENLNLKHLHLKIYFENGILYYQDFRKFGRFKVYDRKIDLNKALKINKDALKVDADYLKKCFNTSKRAIKTLLLDQKLVAGIGNIYSDEICFMAKIHPLTKGNKIKDFNILASAIITVLNKYIETAIDSIDESAYISWEFHLDTNVHFRENKTCYNCGSLIKKIKVNQRSSYYCEKCQELIK